MAQAVVDVPHSTPNFNLIPANEPLLPIEVVNSVMQYLPAHDVIQSSFASYPLTIVAKKIIRARLSFLDQYALRVFGKNVSSDQIVCNLSAHRTNYASQYDGYSVFQLDEASPSNIFQVTFEEETDLVQFERYPGESLPPFLNVRVAVDLSRSSIDNSRADLFSCFQKPIRIRRSWLESLKAGQPDTLWLDQNTQHVIGLIISRIDNAPGKYDVLVSSVIIKTEYLLSSLEQRLH
ncbi:F-box protein [Schizosaccharomyces cryophilus OY26]|uniref:F-box protein n=1 Tax=Schizosaccharomyces cryophilus (strain OY26 / ATCC MYA-4695 / CBS 11777 / NBRC 106824 / NRRL Y48691) TaxID=653667 RepID=S9VYS0_SCHCR|nr:F-box protein [Schizosaccharomyces cryophilus OY26]EPY52803.1 F-box protein [Schizosaccharomyces cryophilus OY26]